MADILQSIDASRLSGLAIGLATFLIIGVFHPLVIKGEYYLGVRYCIPLFLSMGILSAVASVVVTDTFCSTVLGVVAFSSFWSIKEVREQRVRVERGWFPRNPRRKTSASDENASIPTQD